MSSLCVRFGFYFLLSVVFIFFNSAWANSIKGMYITQGTLEDTEYMRYLIKQAKAVGIDTFVVDMELPGKRYQRNIQLLKQNNIRYVARIIMFPGGGTPQQIVSPNYWQRKYRLVDAAVGYGAEEIQLDYIRYNSHSGSSPERSKNVSKIVQWYKDQLAERNIPLQMDVFGITSFKEEPHIGQNIPLLAQIVDALCPMVYPSHYVPFKEHAATPYETVYKSLTSIKKQFNDNTPVKLVAYIELSNYHYLFSHAKRIAYIQAQLKAVEDAGADGWYAWSPQNRYDILFEVLKTEKLLVNAKK